MKQQTKEKSDYQLDIYEARVKIAIARWRSGVPYKENTQEKASNREKC